MKNLLWATGGIGAALFLLFITGTLNGTFPFLRKATVYSTVRDDVALSFCILVVAIGILFLMIRTTAVPRWAGWASAGILFVDLFLFGGSQNNSRTNPEEHYKQARPMIDFIKQDSRGELVRVNMRNQQGLLMERNQGFYDRIQLMEGYTPLVLQRYLPPARDWSQLCDMMNAKYRVATDSSRGMLTLATSTTYRPRAYMVYRAQMFSDSASLFRFMQGPTFEPSREVVLETRPSFDASDMAYTPDWTARFTFYSSNAMSLRVTTPKDGYLVFSEIYYPGWNAYVDGVQAPVYRANWNQRMVELKAGTHEVSMRFESESFRRGVWITLATLAVCAAGLVFTLRNRAPRKER